MPLARRLDRPAFRIGLLVASLVVVYLGLVMADVVRIRNDLEAGQRSLTELDLATVDAEGGIGAIAADADRRFQRAADVARSSPWLAVLSPLPVLGNQVEAMRDLTGTATELGELAASAGGEVEAAIDRAAAAPSARVALVDTVIAELEGIRAGLREVEVGAGGWLLPPLAAARRDLVENLDEADIELDDGRRLASALRGFLAGPRRYLILGGNNAEMRAVGIATTSGLAQVGDGAIEVGGFNESGLTILEHPGVPVPPEIETLYGRFFPGRDYRSAVASPNFPVVASLAADISTQNLYGDVDGVIYVDTITLQAMLAVVGPVTVDGFEYSFENAATELLNENYLRFQTPEDNPERRALQSQVALAIFDAINNREISLTGLAAVLSDLARSRHLLAWSSDPAENELWERFGASGELSPDTLGVISQELGASKLDYYTRFDVAIETSDIEGGPDRDGDGDSDGARRVRLALSVQNPQRDETSPYIDGGSVFAEPGEYGGQVMFLLPDSAYDVVNTEPAFSVVGTDGPVKVVGFEVRVPEGEQRTFVIEFSVPEDQETVDVLPSGRVQPIEYRIDGDTYVDAFPITLPLD